MKLKHPGHMSARKIAKEDGVLNEANINTALRDEIRALKGMLGAVKYLKRETREKVEPILDKALTNALNEAE